MSKYFEPVDTTVNATVADISINNTDIGSASTTMTLPIKQPKEYTDDFIVYLKASDIKKVRNYCKSAKKSKFPLHELLLAISTTCIGCFLGAVTSNVELNSLKGVLMYIVCGIIASGSLVGYFFVRKNSIDDINDLADQVMDYIVDPDKL